MFHVSAVFRGVFLLFNQVEMLQPSDNRMSALMQMSQKFRWGPVGIPHKKTVKK
jgi:hypothetical protein